MFNRLSRRILQTIAILAMLGVLCVAVSLGSLWLDYHRETTLPTPTGRFAVGRTLYDWSDPVHSDPLAPQPGTKRELFAWIWYPAAPGQSQSVDDYWPNPGRAVVEKVWGITRYLTRDLSRVRAHSFRDAEVSSSERSYPVILTLGGISFTSLAEDLASHGYVVVSFEVAYSSLLVLPDGRVIPSAPENDLDIVGQSELDRIATKVALAGSADMSFALDQLERLNTSDPSGKFFGRLDTQRVGAFGHSIRGATALQFCHDDSRCKVCIDLDGIPWGSSAREGITQPSLFILSDHRGEAEDDETRYAKANFGSLFAKLPSDRWMEIMIQGANHYLFSDDAVLRSPLLMGVLRALRIEKIDGRRQLAVTAHFIQTFFDVHLKGDPASDLNPQAEYPEVEYTH